jgi:hypothetical protein
LEPLSPQGEPGVVDVLRQRPFDRYPGVRPDGMGPYESDDAQALAAPPSASELLKLVDRVIRFAQAGIDGAQ